MMHAVVIGTGSYLPEHVVTNDDLADLVDTSDEWITTRTGIKQRRITTGENTSELAYKASVKALENSGLDAEELDLIICATVTPDSFMPSVACIVQGRLGAVRAAAYDLTAACTGFIYGLATAASFIGSGLYKNILVIGAETLSKTLNWSDRSTCVLFGDGAGAAVVSADATKPGIMSVRLTSDGSKQDCLNLPGIPISNPFVNQDVESYRPYISMKGQEVFKYAIRSVTDLVKEILDNSGLDKEDIKYVIAHQANQRIIEQAAKASGIPLERFYMNVDRYGNTSAATIGIALDEMVHKSLLQPGDKLILVGFGAGMTSGAILMEWG